MTDDEARASGICLVLGLVWTVIAFAACLCGNLAAMSGFISCASVWFVGCLVLLVLSDR